MAALSILWTEESRNKKTGPMPVTTTAKAFCAPGCPLQGTGCYAAHGGMSYLWNGLSGVAAGESFRNGRATLQSISWSQLTENVAALPANQIWRHNQAGDLPHDGGVIDAAAVEQLVEANSGRRGFTYTHHDPALGDNASTIAAANAAGFTINLSANNAAHADELAALNIAPVVVLLPADVQGNANLSTPAGRRIVVCPATYRDGVSCVTCGLCQKQRDAIVGFPAHGSGKRKVSEIAAA